MKNLAFSEICSGKLSAAYFDKDSDISYSPVYLIVRSLIQNVSVMFINNEVAKESKTVRATAAVWFHCVAARFLQCVISIPASVEDCFGVSYWIDSARKQQKVE